MFSFKHLVVDVNCYAMLSCGLSRRIVTANRQLNSHRGMLVLVVALHQVACAVYRRLYSNPQVALAGHTKSMVS